MKKDLIDTTSNLKNIIDYSKSIDKEEIKYNKSIEKKEIVSNKTNEEEITPADIPANPTESTLWNNEDPIATKNPIEPTVIPINPANLDPEVFPLELLNASARENLLMSVLFKIILF